MNWTSMVRQKLSFTNSRKELRGCGLPIERNNTKHFLCPIRSQHLLYCLEMVRWESVPRAHPCLKTFVTPFLLAWLTAPGSPRMNTLIVSECTYIQMLSVKGLGFAILTIFRHSYPVPSSLFSKKAFITVLNNLSWTMSHKIILSPATHKMSSVHSVWSIAFCLASNADWHSRFTYIQFAFKPCFLLK